MKVMKGILLCLMCWMISAFNNNVFAQLSGENGTLSRDDCHIVHCQYNPDKHEYLTVLTNKIKEWEGVRTGAFSDNGSGVIVNHNNAFWGIHLDDSFMKKLFEINEKNYRIKDVTISEDGNYWGVVYGFNAWYACAPQKFYDELNYFVNKNIGINSIAINSNGDYIIIGDDYQFRASPKYAELITAAMLMYGRVLSADINKKGFILCCERGITGSLVPSSVTNAIKKVNFLPKVIKISDSGHYLMSNDDDGCYWYWF